MANALDETLWVDRFTGLAWLNPVTKKMLVDRSVVIEADKGTTIFGPGNSPENLLFLLEGTVRAQQTSESGREIVLYRIEAGQSCVLTTACLLAYEDYTAEGKRSTVQAQGSVSSGNASSPADMKLPRAANTRTCPTRRISNGVNRAPDEKPKK